MEKDQTMPQTRIRIGILEDEALCFKNLNDCIMKYGEENDIAFEVDLFTDGLSLVEADFTQYDIIFLDIQVPMVDGLKVSRRIREKDKNVIIIFVTNLAQYAINGYEVDALDYILKPVKYPSMKFRLERAIKRMDKISAEGKITIYVNREKLRLPISGIYYIEANKHQTIYHTESGDYEVWKSFTEAKKELEQYSFAQCHGSYLCNLKWVDTIKGDEVRLKNMDILKLSRNQKKIFEEALMLYWAGIGG